MNHKLMAQLLVLFVVTQSIGLFAGNYLVKEQIAVTIVNDDKESVDNSLGLIAWILGTTVVLLALIAFAPAWLFSIVIKAVESLAIFSTAIIVIAPAEPSEIIGYGAALLLVALRIIFSKNLWLRNISSIVATAGAGALIGASLGVLPILVFLILLSAYDFIAVFKTKHMVKLAKGLTGKNLSFTFALPTKEHQFELGTGDMVVPLVFSVGLLAQAQGAFPFPHYLFPSTAILVASLAGLVITLDYASKHKGTPLPALPLQAALMVVVFIVLKLGGF
ncbi:MAG TPA: presenilin family intramembrane aspartyl protease [archaeon]|nr:presenilin family intramembrane aspartyl protease [archaeon]